MGAWSYTESATLGGVFRLVFTKRGRGGSKRDVTFFRDVPAQIQEFSDADPFGDATGQISFPQITAFDDLSAPEIGSWLAYYADVDLYWVHALPADPVLYPDEPLVLDANSRPVLVAPLYTNKLVAGVPTPDQRNFSKVFEGFVADMGFAADESSSGLSVDLQGAVFQVDRYLAKPFFPLQPWPVELLINEQFLHSARPHLRTQPLRIAFPAGWASKVPKYSPGTNTVYTNVAKPGTLWSGFTSRDSGGWDHALTGYVQNQLTTLITSPGCGVLNGNQWTVHHYREGESVPAGLDRDNRGIAVSTSPGRLPVLEVRNRRRLADLSLWVGTPGLHVDVHGDSTQSADVVYGEGTGVDGTGWRNAVVSTNRTDYLPLAWSPDVWPVTKDNPNYDSAAFTSEAYVKYGAGFDLPDAVKVAGQQLARDRDPGWSGSMTLSTDPSLSLSRWQIKAGMTVKLLGFAGSGVTGVNFHIAATSKHPLEGTVELTVDTRYRDLLTVAEAQARTRDPMTPLRLLQVGKASVTIEDIEAPWDYRAGSGFIPHGSVHFYDQKPVSQLFPYDSWTLKHIPTGAHKASYVRCNAYSSDSRKRWAGPIPIRMSERGTIARAEFRVVNGRGQRLHIPFHVSLYYWSGTAPTNMPLKNGVYSPYLDNAFEPMDGNGAPNDSNLTVPDGFLIGWGNKQRGVLNRAGFWPGRETDNDPPTGLLVDESDIDFDLTGYHQFYAAANPPGRKPQNSDVEIYAMFYAEYHEAVYFQGRLFRQNPGVPR